MRIGFVYSEKYKKYDKLINEIVQNVSNKDDQLIAENITSKTSRKKYDLYVFLSDDTEDFNYNITKLKCKDKVILITENLSEEYITYVINNVVDIIYSKNDIETILKRILSSINKICKEKLKKDM